MQPLVWLSLTVLHGLQQASDSLAYVTTTLVGPPARLLWASGIAASYALVMAWAALCSVLMAPLHMLMALWAMVTGTGGVALQQMGSFLWPGLQLASQTVAASSTAFRYAATPALAVGSAAVKAGSSAVAAAASATAGGTGAAAAASGFWSSLGFEAFDLVKGTAYRLFKAFQAVLNCFVNLALGVARHRASLMLQVQSASRRTCAGLPSWRRRVRPRRSLSDTEYTGVMTDPLEDKELLAVSPRTMWDSASDGTVALGFDRSSGGGRPGGSGGGDGSEGGDERGDGGSGAAHLQQQGLRRRVLGGPEAHE